MNFGKQVISNQIKTYNMVAEMQQLKGTEGDENKVPLMSSFAQVQDTRGNYEWLESECRHVRIHIRHTKNNVLTGARIIFADSRIQYEGGGSRVSSYEPCGRS